MGDKIMSDYEGLEERLRTVEMAVVELSTMSRMLRACVGLLALSLGVDVTGVL